MWLTRGLIRCSRPGGRRSFAGRHGARTRFTRLPRISVVASARAARRSGGQSTRRGVLLLPRCRRPLRPPRRRRRRCRPHADGSLQRCRQIWVLASSAGCFHLATRTTGIWRGQMLLFRACVGTWLRRARVATWLEAFACIFCLACPSCFGAALLLVWASSFRFGCVLRLSCSLVWFIHTS